MGGSEDQDTIVGGRYRIEKELGRGGMGAVYEAIDTSERRIVALKRLHADGDGGSSSATGTSTRMATLFEREYHTLRSLKHPGIVEVYDFGRDATGPYYAMELLQGRDLQALAPLPVQQACRYIRDAASALALLHARRMVHRDVSPRNIHVTDAGDVKLLDFGAMAPFGPVAEVVGTPPCIPPEAVTGGAVDQRLDLYGLGAVAYYALTGKHAYPARALNQLPTVWRQPVAPPSSHAQGIPKELDALILSMLDSDPRARPSSAGEVILHLNRIAKLSQDADTRVLMSYLDNPELVGREDELERGRVAFDRCLHQERGGAMLLEGHAGMGRTRLLTEMRLVAQVGGLRVASAEAARKTESLSTLSHITSQLLNEYGDDAIELARPHAPVLAGLASRIARLSEAPDPRKSRGAPAPAQADIEQAFIDWVTGLARRHPLLIAVDDLHAIDAESAAVLAALARASQSLPLLVLATTRAGDQGLAPNLLEAFSTCGPRLPLSPLGEEDVHQWVGSLFGDVPNLGRLSSRLHELSAGTPAHLMELVRHLVEAKVITYEGGLWQLPEELPEDAVGGGFEGLLLARLDDVDDAARALAESVCVLSAPITVEIAMAMGDGLSREAAFAQLGALVQGAVLSVDGGKYRFSHPRLRTSLYENLSAERRQAAHARAAQALQPLAKEWTAKLAVADHLMRGGREMQGADRVATLVATRFPGLEEKINLDTVERALEEYRRAGRSQHAQATLLGLLGVAATIAGHDYADRHGDAATEVLGNVTGLAAARRLRRYLGGTLALVIALSWAALRRMFVPRRDRIAPFGKTVADTCGVASALVGSAVSRGQFDKGRRWACNLGPFQTLPPDTAGRVLWDLTEAMLDERLEAVADRRPPWFSLAQRLQATEGVKGLGEEEREAILAGAYFALGISDAHSATAAHEWANKLDQLQHPLSTVYAPVVRRLACLQEGDQPGALRAQAELDQAVVRMGPQWRADATASIGVEHYHLLHDDVANHRIDDASRARREAAQEHADTEVLARAGDLANDGEYARARELLEAWLRDAPDFAPGAALGAYDLAQACAALGDHEAGRNACLAKLDTFGEPMRDFPFMILRLEQALAECEIGLKQFERGRARLRELIQRYEQSQNPVILGNLHEALTTLEHAADDQDAALEHLAHTERFYRSTGYPTLLQAYEALRNLVAPQARLSQAPAPGAVATLRERAKGKADPAERAAEVLSLLLEECGSQDGFLYLAEDGAPKQAAPSAPAPDDVLEVVTGLFKANADVTATDTMTESTAMTDASVTEQCGYFTCALFTTTQTGPRMVGALSLRQGDGFSAPSIHLVDAVAGILTEPGDVVSAVGQD